MAIYNKFYNDLFGDTKKYSTFLKRCCIFGEILRKKEKDILILRLRTKTRYKDIWKAERNINFDEKEKDRLAAIKLMYDLRE